MHEWTDPPATEDALLEWFHTLRAVDPVHLDPEKGGWHILGYDECKQALLDHEHFSSTLAAPVPRESPMSLFRIGNLSWLDPPRHSKLRALVRAVFTPRYVASLQPMIEKVIDNAMNNLRGNDRCRFVDQFAEPVAENVISELLGLPEDQRTLFGSWTRALFSLSDPAEKENKLSTVVNGTRQIKEYLEALIEDRRRNPKEDLTSLLTVAEVDGEKIADDEIAGLMALLVLTGQTTTQTLSNSLICLDENPQTHADVRADHGLLSGMVDEVMRYRSQTPRVARITTKPVELAGHKMGAGEPVSVWLAAADRDPKAFPDPDVFDVRRSPNQHIALGYGIHYCLGAPVARMEVEISLRQILTETSDLSVDHERSQRLDPRLAFGAGELQVELAW